MARFSLLLLLAAGGALGVGALGENRTEERRPEAVERFRSFQACLANFEIHTDKIIRTDDSRKMGAQYISETDVATRDECVHLCCTTHTCDVFVFEDKRPGSCYLFNCGSSDDFKCKFTKHHNYTSGIMTESRQGNDPQERDLPSKHEQELNLLRMSQPESSGANRTAPLAQLPGSGVAPAPVVDRAKENKTVEPPPSERTACSRFQFKCRMSGECIAIYNACDGIPQCADGSDESAELNCPVAVTAASSVLLPAAAPAAAAAAAAAPSTPSKSDPDPPAYDSGFQRPPKEQGAAEGAAAAEARGPVEGTDAATAFHNLNAFDAKAHLNEEPPLKKTPPFEELHHLPPHFTKPDDVMPNNPPPPYAGYRPYMNVPREQESENVEEERAYLAAKALNERAEHAYRSKFLQQEQSGGAGGEGVAPFKHLPRPPFPEALRHLSEEARLHEGGPDVPDQQLFNAHAHEASLQKTKSDTSLPLDFNRSEMKMATQIASYAEPPPPPPPPQQPRLYKYEDENRHIFTHKGYGLVADGDRPELPPHQLLPGVRFKAEREGGAHHLLVAPGQQPQPLHHQDQHQLFKLLKNTPEPLEGENGYLVPADYLYDEMQLRPQAINPNLQQRLHDFHHHVEAVAAHSSKPAAENTSSSVEEKPPEHHRDAHAQSKEAEQHSFLRSPRERVVEVQQAEVLEAPAEEQRERPSGALLSMSFGLCITLIMAVLVACRLKVVKRRFRRNGKSMYAHDADYLVNGMYL